MDINKKTLGSVLLFLSIIIGIYGIMLATGESAQHKTWAPPFSEYEIKTIISIGIGIIGSIGSVILSGYGKK